MMMTSARAAAAVPGCGVADVVLRTADVYALVAAAEVEAHLVTAADDTLLRALVHVCEIQTQNIAFQ